MARTEDTSRADESRPAIPSSAARLGPSFIVDGVFSASEDVVIQGTFKGSLELKNASLYIDRKAQVEASVSAKDVYVYGTIAGPIRASGRVFLSTEADVKGDISAARLSVEDGARFRGGVVTGKSGLE
jgi:cytoskeletal protein CcmA (bactofilin family)